MPQLFNGKAYLMLWCVCVCVSITSHLEENEILNIGALLSSQAVWTADKVQVQKPQSTAANGPLLRTTYSVRISALWIYYCKTEGDNFSQGFQMASWTLSVSKFVILTVLSFKFRRQRSLVILSSAGLFSWLIRTKLVNYFVLKSKIYNCKS